MHTYTKVGAALAVVLVAAGGAYYLGTPAPLGDAAPQAFSTEMLSVSDEGSARMGDDVAAATASLDDFSAAVAAELAAQDAALSELDADVDESVSTVINGTNTYDISTL